MTNTLESIARGEIDADIARTEIDCRIKATQDFAKPYSALLRWTWLALSERRADEDLRHWHRLILDVTARAGQEDSAASKDPDAEGPAAQFAERLRAMSDMVRVSIGMQSRPDKARLLTRAHVPAILQALNDRCNEAVARADLVQAVEMKTANLSRILTLLILEGLVERQADGRTARFRITGEGIKRLDLGVYQARNSKLVETTRPVVEQKRQTAHYKTSEAAETSREPFDLAFRILENKRKAKQGPTMYLDQLVTRMHASDLRKAFARPRPQPDILESFTVVKPTGLEYKPFETMCSSGAEKLADC